MAQSPPPVVHRLLVSALPGLILYSIVLILRCDGRWSERDNRCSNRRRRRVQCQGYNQCLRELQVNHNCWVDAFHSIFAVHAADLRLDVVTK